MTHFWPGSFVIVAMPPLALHMQKGKQRKRSPVTRMEDVPCCLSCHLCSSSFAVCSSCGCSCCSFSSSCRSVCCCSLLILAITACFPDSGRVEELVMGPYQRDLIILCFGSLPRCLNIASRWVSVVKFSQCSSGVSMSKDMQQGRIDH
jgi:hypothetical protein